MIIDLSEIIKDYGGKMSVSAPVEMNDTDFLGESFVFEKPLNINGTIINNTKSLEFTAKVEGEMQVHCARCNKPFVVPVKFRVHEILASEDSGIQDDETVVFSGEKLDITDIVLNSFLMNVSGKYLCSEDCKGLCPKCGADLNEGKCSCDSDEIDPRWADLQEIMKNMTDTE
jgi:uncharacterized protein